MKEQNDLRLMEMLTPKSKSRMAKQLFKKRMRQLQSEEDSNGARKKKKNRVVVASTNKSVSSMTNNSLSSSSDEEEDEEEDDLGSKSSQFSGYYNKQRCQSPPLRQPSQEAEHAKYGLGFNSKNVDEE